MARSLVYGAVIECPSPLPYLPTAPGANHPADIVVESAPVLFPGDFAYRQWFGPDGGTWLSFARCGARYFLEFPGIATFEFLEEARKIRYSCSEGTPSETFRHLLIDIIVPLSLAAQGKVVLHAGAVQGPDGAIVFLGSSGHGKSTLAAAFAREGGMVLGDDAIRIQEDGGEFLALPSYPSLRLWEDMASRLFEGADALPSVAHYTAKKRVALSLTRPGPAAGGFPLRKVFVLELARPVGNDRIRIDLLTQREACVEILRHSFCLDPSDRTVLQAGLDRASEMSRKTPFFRLEYPRRIELLPEIRRILLETKDSRHAWSP